MWLLMSFCILLGGIFFVVKIMQLSFMIIIKWDRLEKIPYRKCLQSILFPFQVDCLNIIRLIIIQSFEFE